MTIEQFCNKLEIFLYNEIVNDMKDGSEASDHLFFKYDEESDRYLIKLGLVKEWFTKEVEV